MHERTYYTHKVRQKPEQSQESRIQKMSDKKKVTKHIKLELGLHLIIYTCHRKHRPRKGNAKLA
jgi:hypothetical protein